jgi:O-antigen/teichoic acid export membrane protein
VARTASFVTGTAFAYLYQVVAMLFGLWLTPFILRILGQHDYGVWLVGLQLFNFLLLADFGIVAITPRDVARLTGKAHEGAGSQELIELISKTTKVVLYQTIIVIAGAGIVYYFLLRLSPAVHGPITVALVAFCLSYPFRIYGSVLQGLQDMHFLGQLRMGIWAGSAVISVGLLLLGSRLYALAVGWGFSVFGLELGCFLRLRALRPDLASLKPWKQERTTLRDFVRGLWLSVGQVAQLLTGGSDVLIIAKILGPATVVTYNCTVKLAMVFSNQPLILASTALPGLSQMKTSEPRERVFQVSTSLGQAMFLFSGLIVCVIFSTNQFFVSMWVGPQFFGGIQLTVLFLLSMLLRHLDVVLAQSLFAWGYEKPMSIKAVADGVVSVAIAYFSVHKFGIMGAALGLLGGVLLVSLPTNMVLFSREFGIPLPKILAPYVPYAWRLGVVCCFGHFIARYFQPRTYPFLFAVSAMVVSVYIALTAPYVLRTPLGSYVMGVIDRTWGRFTAVFES